MAEQRWWEPPHEETLPSHQIYPPPSGYICSSVTLGLAGEAGTFHHLWVVQWVFPSAESCKKPFLQCSEWKMNESKCHAACSTNQNSSWIYTQESTTQSSLDPLKPHSLWTSPHSHESLPQGSASHQNGHWSAGVVQKITSPHSLDLSFTGNLNLP